MIRSTINSTIKTISVDGTKINSGLLELTHGSVDGAVASGNEEWTMGEWVANKSTNEGSTMSPIPSDGHWDGNVVNL